MERASSARPRLSVLANWLTSGWWDVLGIVGWMVTVLVIGTLAWRRSGGGERAVPDAKPHKRSGRAAELLGAGLALMAIGATFKRRGGR